MVTGRVELEIGFLHILVSGVGIDNIHDLMALSIIYIMVDGVMSMSIGNRCVGNEVLGESCSYIRLSCLYQI